MHFVTLAAVEIPKLQEDREINGRVAETLEELKIQKQLEPKNLMLDMAIESCYNLQTSFSRTVYRSVCEIMYPYCESIEDPEYLEFYDRTEGLRQEYESGTDCIKLPQGTIVEQYDVPLFGKFIVRDGKVFQKDAGPLHHEKRTKKAKRMQALPDYPRKKLYKSFAEYAEDIRGFSFDETHQGYGYYYNPNTMYDWYSIGGRWPEMFLVKDTCTEYSIGERSWCNADQKSEAPAGYQWVCAARKKDIAWELLRNWRNQKAAEQFYKLERMFLARKKAPDFCGEIVADGIMRWGKLIYRKGSSLEEYLEEYGIPGNWKYPVSAHDIVDADQWLSKEDCVMDSESGSYVPVDWRDCIDKYIDDLDEDTVLVSVDYHI